MKGALILAIAISFTPVAMSVDNQPARAHNGRKAENTPPPATVNVNCNTCAQTDQSKDQPKGWHKLIAWPEGIATIALILTLGAIVWQSVETRRSAQAANRQIDLIIKKERARLTVERPDTLQKGDEAFGLYEVSIVVKIYGPTDAFKVQAWAIADGLASEQGPITKPLRQVSIPPTIESGSKDFALSHAFMVRDWAEIESGKKILHFAGRISYIDIFDNPHETTFRYFWKEETFRPAPEAPLEDWSKWERGSDADNRET